MKNTVFFLCFFIAIITSCTSNTVDENAHLIGTWELTEWTIETPVDLNNDGVLTTSFSPGCLAGSEIVLDYDAKGTFFYSSNVSYFTRVENNEIVYMTTCSTSSDNVPKAITYTSEENLVYINKDGEMFILSQEVDENLYLVVENGFIVKDIDTFEITESQDITYIFTKK